MHKKLFLFINIKTRIEIKNKVIGLSVNNMIILKWRLYSESKASLYIYWSSNNIDNLIIVWKHLLC